MEFVPGVIVRSAAGRDKGDLQVVVSVDGMFACVCDGKRRPIERPKRKKRKHLFLTNNVLDICGLSTNKAIRSALKNFK
jgi:ribosomal protein L14E/L6E/L27E